MQPLIFLKASVIYITLINVLKFDCAKIIPHNKAKINSLKSAIIKDKRLLRLNKKTKIKHLVKKMANYKNKLQKQAIKNKNKNSDKMQIGVFLKTVKFCFNNNKGIVSAFHIDNKA